MKKIKIEEKEEVCANCSHYYQHYVISPYRWDYMPINCGHCVYPRRKDRKPGETCQYFSKEQKR